MTDLELKLREAFLLGFMISRQGFNAEYVGQHDAPTKLHPDDGDTIENFREQMAETEIFCDLQNMAIGRLMG